MSRTSDEPGPFPVGRVDLRSGRGTATVQAETLIVPLSEMKDGQRADCFVVLAEKDLRSTRTDKPFYSLVIRDRTRKVIVRIWSDSEFFSACEQEWKPGQFFKIRGTYQETEWGPQLALEKVRPASDGDAGDGFSPVDFLERSRFDVEEMFRELWDLADKHIDDQPLRRLTLSLLERSAAGIKKIPAATHNHHAFLGGYLEHVVSVTRNAVHLADKYAVYYPDLDPPISRSLVVAGAILHDIGKLRELDCQQHQTVYSVPGRLLGHMILGRDMVREEAAAVKDLAPEKLLLLEHIIAAHQGQREWGAVVEPQTIECLLVHYADDIDAKVNMMAEAIRRDKTDGPFTSRDNPLRRSLYKGDRAADEK